MHTSGGAQERARWSDQFDYFIKSTILLVLTPTTHTHIHKHNVIISLKKTFFILKLDSKHQTENKAVNFYFIEKRTTRVNLKQRPCGQYNVQEYLDCSKESFWKLFQEKATCIVYNIGEFVPKNQTLLSQCPTKEESEEAVDIFFEILKSLSLRSSTSVCLLPCSMIGYKFR